MSLTIKQAFAALSDACANGMKNPFFVMRRLKESFADVADKVVDASGDKVTVTPITDSGTKIAEIKVNNTTSELYAPTSDAKVFIDTANKITSGDVKGSLTYTATQDCFISLYCVATSGVDGVIKIDNQSMGGWIFSGTAATSFHFYLKSGQVITVTNLDNSYDSSYNVYALK